MVQSAVEQAGNVRRRCGVDEIAYAIILQKLLPIIIGVPLFAWFGRSRVVFLLGMLGLLLGFVVPEPRIYAHYSSVEAAYLGSLYSHASHVATWSSFGAVGGTLCGYLFLLWRGRGTAEAGDQSPQMSPAVDEAHSRECDTAIPNAGAS